MSEEAQHEPQSIWSPLSVPHFRFFWIGMCLSTAAFWMQNIAVTWLMREWTNGDAVMVSLVQTALFLPVMLLSLIAGTLADMFDRRRFLIFSQVWMMMAPLMIAGLVLLGIRDPLTLLGVTILLAVGNAMKLPSQAALIPSLIDKERLPFAISLNSMAVNGGRIVGPAIAGGLLPLIGGFALFIANSAVYLIYIVILVLLPQSPTRTANSKCSFSESLRDLFAFVGQSRSYRVILLRGGLYFCVWSTVLAVVPLITEEASEFGFLYGLFGAGAVFGASFYGHLSRLATRSQSLTVAIILHAVCIGLLALGNTLTVLSALMALIGFGSFFIMTTLQVSAQLQLPDELRGRGLALMTTVFMGATALSSPIWGTMVAQYSPQTALVTASIISLFCAALLSRSKIDP